jgi:hypothetical protein
MDFIVDIVQEADLCVGEPFGIGRRKSVSVPQNPTLLQKRPNTGKNQKFLSSTTTQQHDSDP